MPRLNPDDLTATRTAFVEDAQRGTVTVERTEVEEAMGAVNGPEVIAALDAAYAVFLAALPARFRRSATDPIKRALFRRLVERW
jgi:hypothetical protein